MDAGAGGSKVMAYSPTHSWVLWRAHAGSCPGHILGLSGLQCSSWDLCWDPWKAKLGSGVGIKIGADFPPRFACWRCLLPPPAQAHEDSWEGSKQHGEHNSPISAEAQAVVFKAEVQSRCWDGQRGKDTCKKGLLPGMKQKPFLTASYAFGHCAHAVSTGILTFGLVTVLYDLRSLCFSSAPSSVVWNGKYISNSEIERINLCCLNFSFCMLITYILIDCIY